MPASRDLALLAALAKDTNQDLTPVYTLLTDTICGRKIAPWRLGDAQRAVIRMALRNESAIKYCARKGQLAPCKPIEVLFD